MTTINSIAALKDELAVYRRELHQNPQTSYEETFANNLVSRKLTEWGIPFKSGLGVTGIVATIEGQKTDSGKAIGLRCDMDALDMTETSGQEWASKIPGKMHGCGHDGHTAMLLGAAKYLSETRNFNGTVYLIFQPAEEGGGGAARMMEDGLFNDFKMDAVFGMHNWPNMPKGHIGLRAGPIMASTSDFHVTVRGKGGHAAMPHLNVDPIPVAAQIITALQTVVSRQVDPVDQAVLSVTNINGGSGATNVIPDFVTFTGTFRTFRMETRTMIAKRVEEISRALASAHGCSAVCEIDHGYNPTINTAAEAAFCAEVARALVGPENVNADVEPCMGAEDFGAMLQGRPGCYIWMGQGEPGNPASPHNKGLHNTGYDFNDEVIPTGVEYWVRVSEAALPLTK